MLPVICIDQVNKGNSTCSYCERKSCVKLLPEICIDHVAWEQWVLDESKSCPSTPWGVNPLTLRAAKTGLTILEIFLSQKRFLENSLCRNVKEKSNNNSPSNIL